MVQYREYNKSVNKSGTTAERKHNIMKKKMVNAALTLGGATVLWFSGWGALMCISEIMSFLNI